MVFEVLHRRIFLFQPVAAENSAELVLVARASVQLAETAAFQNLALAVVAKAVEKTAFQVETAFQMPVLYFAEGFVSGPVRAYLNLFPMDGFAVTIAVLGKIPAVLPSYLERAELIAEPCLKLRQNFPGLLSPSTPHQAKLFLFVRLSGQANGPFL